MKLVVLRWFWDSFISFIGKLIEVLFRILLLLTPLFVFLVVLQNRSKASKVSNISVYTKDESIWQHIFPGFILVAVDPDIFKNELIRCRRTIQTWVESNKYLLALLFVSLIVSMLIIINSKISF